MRAGPGPVHHPLVRVLSKLGVCSRTQAVDLVRAGRVSVGGKVVRDPGAPCAFSDPIAVDGRALAPSTLRYVLLNKPRGVVTTRSDERGRTTIYDLLGGLDQWLVPAGRLDRESDGLLVLTNDTRFAAWLTDPANEVPRVYEVTVRPPMTEAQVAALTAGVDIGRGETSAPSAAHILAVAGTTATIELVLTEGRNREVRRLFQALARRVLRLRRTRFGPFSLGDLPPGRWIEAPITEGAARRYLRRKG